MSIPEDLTKAVAADSIAHAIHLKSIPGWVGVDFDGTLSIFAMPFSGLPGQPIAPMVERVKLWLSMGIDVRIVTARMAPTNAKKHRDQCRAYIQQWCKREFGRHLPIVAHKDYNMIELWDDRARRVGENNGIDIQAYAVGLLERLSSCYTTVDKGHIAARIVWDEARLFKLAVAVEILLPLLKSAPHKP